MDVDELLDGCDDGDGGDDRDADYDDDDDDDECDYEDDDGIILKGGRNVSTNEAERWMDAEIPTQWSVRGPLLRPVRLGGGGGSLRRRRRRRYYGSRRR